MQDSGVYCCPLPTGCTSAAAKGWKWVSALRCLGGSQLWEWVCVKLLLLGGPSLGGSSSLVLPFFSRVSPTSFLERKSSGVLPPIPPACTQQVGAGRRGVTLLGCRIWLCASCVQNTKTQPFPRGLLATTATKHLVCTRSQSLSFGHLPQGSGAGTLLQPRARAVLSWDHGILFQKHRDAARRSLSGRGEEKCLLFFLGVFFGSPSTVLHEKLLTAGGCAHRHRGKVLWGTGLMIKSPQGLVGGLAFTWCCQRMEAGGGPSQFSDTT